MSSPVSSLRSLGIGPKFILVTAVISVALALILTAVATRQMEKNLIASGVLNGEALASSVVDISKRSSSAGITSLQPFIDALRDAKGIRYLYVADSSRNVLVHTFQGPFPQELHELNALGPEGLAEGHRVQAQTDVDMLVNDERLRVIDVALPLVGAVRGAVHVGVNREHIDEQVDALWTHMLLLALGLVVLGVGAAAVFGRTIVRPLRELNAVAAHIVESGDLTRPVNVPSGDEVGQLAHSFAQMVERLRTVTINLQQAANALTASTEHLNASSAQQSQTISRQAAALQETQVTAQEIKQTSLLASQKADAVLSVVERADELSRTGEAAIEQTMVGLNDIRAQVEEIAAKILELGERTVQIGGITQTVKDLADQSNMLALNAAIEAVRSGEHGKGFGVVAREIRALADQSIQATARVRELLDDIGNSVSLAVRITERGSQRMDAGLNQVRTYGKNLRELSTIIQDNAAAVRQIAAAVNQQNVGINQITAAVSDLSKMMEETVARISTTGEAATTLQVIADQLDSAVRSYRVE